MMLLVLKQRQDSAFPIIGSWLVEGPALIKEFTSQPTNEKRECLIFVNSTKSSTYYTSVRAIKENRFAQNHEVSSLISSRDKTVLVDFVTSVLSLLDRVIWH